jgi:Lysyl oxidase
VHRKVLTRRLAPTLLACAAATALLAALVRSDPAAGGRPRLPDLDQLAPYQLEITPIGPAAHRRYRLGFASAVSNVGAGPLILDGHRDARATTMTADQVVEQDGAPKALLPDAGHLRYVRSPDHRHWHLLGFDRYMLRRAGETRAVVADRKTGFCLGDRYPDAHRDTLPAAPEDKVYRGRCGLDHPDMLGVQEGISIGYGDAYAANLEGQYLPLDGLAAGRYVLVHHVNADGRLHELDYTNNAASLLLRLRWRHGVPSLTLLRTCPDTDRCDR